MTPVEDRLTELRRHLRHLRDLTPRVESAEDLEEDLSLHNDVLFSLLTVAQLVIDVAGHFSAEGGLPFQDYTTAVRNLAHLPDKPFPRDMVRTLERLPGFRNILVHEYVGLDYDLVVRAVEELEPVEAFAQEAARRLAEEAGER